MNKREAIIEAAIELFSAKGLNKTKIADIVKQANIAQGTFYLYFSSKLSVMPAIAEVMALKIRDEMDEQVDRHEPFPVQIEQLTQAVFTITKEYQTIQALVYAGIASTDHIRNWESIYDPLYIWVDNFLKQAVTEKFIPPINGETPKMVIALVESVAEQAYLYDEVDPQVARNKQAAVVTFLLQALKASPSIS